MKGGLGRIGGGAAWVSALLAFQAAVRYGTTAPSWYDSACWLLLAGAVVGDLLELRRDDPNPVTRGAHAVRLGSTGIVAAVVLLPSVGARSPGLITFGLYLLLRGISRASQPLLQDVGPRRYLFVVRILVMIASEVGAIVTLRRPPPKLPRRRRARGARCGAWWAGLDLHPSRFLVWPICFLAVCAALGGVLRVEALSREWRDEVFATTQSLTTRLVKKVQGLASEKFWTEPKPVSTLPPDRTRGSGRPGVRSTVVMPTTTTTTTRPEPTTTTTLPPTTSTTVPLVPDPCHADNELAINKDTDFGKAVEEAWDAPGHNVTGCLQVGPPYRTVGPHLDVVLFEGGSSDPTTITVDRVRDKVDVVFDTQAMALERAMTAGDLTIDTPRIPTGEGNWQVFGAGGGCWSGFWSRWEGASFSEVVLSPQPTVAVFTDTVARERYVAAMGDPTDVGDLRRYAVRSGDPKHRAPPTTLYLWTSREDVPRWAVITEDGDTPPEQTTSHDVNRCRGLAQKLQELSLTACRENRFTRPTDCAVYGPFLPERKRKRGSDKVALGPPENRAGSRARRRRLRRGRHRHRW